MTWIPRRPCWISSFHSRKWVIQWKRTFCRNILGKRGWRPPIWPRRGQNMWDYLRSCGVGGCSSGICQWTRRGGYGVAGPLRRCPLNWSCRRQNNRISFAVSMTRFSRAIWAFPSRNVVRHTFGSGPGVRE